MKKLTIILIIIYLFSFGVSAQIETEAPSCKKRELQKWELLSQEGKHEEAIVELQKQIDLGDKKSKNRDYWHLGQLYAYNNDYETAIVCLKKSTNFIGLLFDKYWRYYYKGTLAFLERDKNKLQKYYKKIQKGNSAYYEGNVNTLKSLYNQFDKTYLEAYSSGKN
jgi:tetratricopeptide (TPR) repeat protein